MAKTHAKRLPASVILSRLAATCGLALPAATANAATNAKQRVTQPAKKPEAKKQEAKRAAAKPAAKKDAKPAREPSSKKPAAKKTAKAKRGKKPADEDDDDEDEKKPQVPPLTGDLAVVKKVIDLARDGETD